MEESLELVTSEAQIVIGGLYVDVCRCGSRHRYMVLARVSGVFTSRDHPGRWFQHGWRIAPEPHGPTEYALQLSVETRTLYRVVDSHTTDITKEVDSLVT